MLSIGESKALNIVKTKSLLMSLKRSTALVLKELSAIRQAIDQRDQRDDAMSKALLANQQVEMQKKIESLNEQVQKLEKAIADSNSKAAAVASSSSVEKKRGKLFLEAPQAKFYIIDTNVLLEQHSPIFEAMKLRHNESVPLCKRRFVIPFVVMNELDCIHKNPRPDGDYRRKPPLHMLAKDAMRQLESLRLNKQQSIVMMQQMNQVIDLKDKKNLLFFQDRISNDDKILICCLYFAEELQDKAKVVLVSNDKNLRLKCSYADITTMTLHEFKYV